jgi:creatinine amidohydrolase
LREATTMTRSPTRYWHELGTRDFQTMPVERLVAVLPVGAIEQHGPHLPVGVDALINQGIVRRAIEVMPAELPALILPMSWVGRSVEHVDFPGTLTLGAETLARVWYEIGASVARAGVRRLLILNSHGGQIQAMQTVGRELRIRQRMLVATASWPQLGLPDGLVGAEERQFGIHAGDVETSLMLALHAELVAMERAADFVPLTRRLREAAPLLVGLGAAGFGWQAQDLHPDGACGDATAATAARGRAILDHVATRLVALIGELAAFDLTALRDGPRPPEEEPGPF